MEPYLSIVASSRNDNHGGDMRKRMRIFVRGLIYQTKKYKLPCELIMVEWNPIEGEQLLHEILPKPDHEYLTIRYIVVPHSYHTTLKNHHSIPLFQMIAKNVGIRRAKADWVLCTNVDLLFSNELFEFFAKRGLKENHFYRANRCDIPKNIDENLSVEEMLTFSKQNILKRLGKNKHFPNLVGIITSIAAIPVLGPYLLKPLSLLKRILDGKRKTLFLSADTDACGDFTMMRKSDWEKIEGYAEFEIYSIHIDSMGIYGAIAKDIQQVVLPYKMCTYHISHDAGWEFNTPLDRLKFTTARPMLDWWIVFDSSRYIWKNKMTYEVNPDNWGLRDIELEEFTIRA